MKIRELRKLVKAATTVIPVSLVMRSYGISKLGGLKPLLVDAAYRILDEPTVTECLAYDKSNRKRFKRDYRDCDNYALMLSHFFAARLGVNSCAEVMSFLAGHAFSAMPVLVDGETPDPLGYRNNGRIIKWLIIEPQADKILDANDLRRSMYRLRRNMQTEKTRTGIKAGLVLMR